MIQLHEINFYYGKTCYHLLRFIHFHCLCLLPLNSYEFLIPSYIVVTSHQVRWTYLQYDFTSGAERQLQQVQIIKQVSQSPLNSILAVDSAENTTQTVQQAGDRGRWWVYLCNWYLKATNLLQESPMYTKTCYIS